MPCNIFVAIVYGRLPATIISATLVAYRTLVCQCQANDFISPVYYPKSPKLFQYYSIYILYASEYWSVVIPLRKKKV